MATDKKSGKKAATTKEKAAPRKAATKKAATRKAAPRSAAQAPAGGPLTLAEARALAVARRPQAAARGLAQAATPAATPRSMAEERKQLRATQAAERARRTRDYQATMELLKQRGTRRPRGAAPQGAAGAPMTAAAAFMPLQILAEGDSWFDYPPFAIKGGLVPRLERRLGVPILNMAKAGDEVRHMLGVDDSQRLAEQLRQGCPAGGPWDVVLFSGGGNDIVDDPMALWLSDWDPTQPAQAHLKAPRYAAALALVQAGYEDLIAMRDRLSPTTLLVLHAYDMAIPDGRGVCFNTLGPWLKPAFDLRGFPSIAAGHEVVRLMLTQFAAMLQTLVGKHPGVHLFNGQGLLPATPQSWHNEMHPSSGGFDRHADGIGQLIRQLFPSRVA